MKHRLSILLIWFFAIWSLLVFRGLQIQLYPSHNLDLASQKQYQRIVKLYSKRGDIFDRNGQELAISVPAFSLFADPLLIKTPRRLAKKMSQILPLSQKTIYKKITKKNSRFVWIQRLLDENTKKKILALNEKGLGFKDEFKRVYPNKNLMAHTIGFVGADGHGLEGIEARYDAPLSAEEKVMNLPKDARGRFLVEDGWLFMQNRDGADVYLTIDADLQYYTEQELKKALIHHNAEAAWAIVMNPKTGEILTMASLPDFDINNAGAASKESRRNRITTDIYEPGSTMKTMFLAAALKNGIIQGNSVIDTSTGQIEIDKRVIRESDVHHTFEKLSTTEVLANSSNVGVSKISLKMKDKQLYNEYRKFGFGEKTGIDLPGESKGIFATPPWRDHHKANISFGHGIAVTALQMANSYAAIANKGILQKPILVKSQKEILDAKTAEERTIGRVLSEKEAERLKMMLVAATAENATGKSARVRGFPVAGKTGTAQKVDPNGRGYLKDQYISSFIGFLPANDPEFLIYVVVDNPRNNGYYGSETAAPIFAKIAQYAINKRGLAPVQIAEEDLIKPRTEIQEVLLGSEGEAFVPDMKGWALRDVLRYVQKEKVDLNLVGRKGRVVKTAPSVGELWTDDKKLKVYLE
jgi:cell division protein FtsI (penicillin-binding protein 3)